MDTLPSAKSSQGWGDENPNERKYFQKLKIIFPRSALPKLQNRMALGLENELLGQRFIFSKISKRKAATSENSNAGLVLPMLTPTPGCEGSKHGPHNEARAARRYCFDDLTVLCLR